MDQKAAERLASIFGGEAWERKGDWVVTTYQEDGAIALISASGVALFEDEAALDADQPTSAVDLEIPDASERWVLVDRKGNVFYENSELELGWRNEEDAEHEADGLRSRTGDRYSVVQMCEVGA